MNTSASYIYIDSIYYVPEEICLKLDNHVYSLIEEDISYFHFDKTYMTSLHL